MSEQTLPRGIHLGIGAELVFCLSLIAFGCLCLDTTVPNAINFMVVEYLDSALYSQMVGVILVVSGCHQGIEAVRKRGGRHFVPLKLLAGLAMTAAYVLGFAYVGFYLSTFLFLFAFSLLIETPSERDAGRKAFFALLAVGVLYGVFSSFKMYLPPAWLF